MARKHRQRQALYWIKLLVYYGTVFSAIFGVILAILVFIVSKQLPDVTTVSTFVPAETTKIYSSDGIILAELHEEENRVVIPIERISPTLIKTVIALEDTDFYDHHGINGKAVIRALVRDVFSLSFSEGGSTLTQQLARNLFLTKRKTMMRKLEEAILAVQIERHFTKSDILEMYLNQVYWGHNAYGIESASRLYFGKSSEELSIAESAMLVGLLKGPELFSPFRNPKLCKARQRTVLNRMARVDLISKAEANRAFHEHLQLAERKRFRYKAPYFTSWVIEDLIRRYGENATFTAGLKVQTTLNYRMQEKAEHLAKKYAEVGTKPFIINDEPVANLNYNQVSLLAMDPRNGHILAMQGGVDFKDSQFNRVTQALRQPGSAFKPFVYLAALQKGFSPGSFVLDAPVTFQTVSGPYSPQNYTKKYLGSIPLHTGLEQSVNVVAIKLNNMVGPQATVEVARKLGIRSRLLPVLSLPLGANEVSMMELTSAYGVIANLGVKVEPVAILSIEDRNGVPLYKHRQKEERVFEKNTVAALVEMMKGVINYGTGRAAKLPRPCAGKTGTTSDYKDAWFVGFIPQIVCATWVGNDDNKPMNQVTGGFIPAAMWRDFMTFAVQNIPPEDFGRPSNLVERQVNWGSGDETGEIGASNNVRTEQYWEETAPSDTSPVKKVAPRKKAINQEEKVKNFFQ